MPHSEYGMRSTELKGHTRDTLYFTDWISYISPIGFPTFHRLSFLHFTEWISYISPIEFPTFHRLDFLHFAVR